MPVSVLRLGHRHERDARVSTHCGLVARALGAQEIVYTGEPDEKLIESVKSVANRWGGPFKVRYEKSYRKAIANYKRKCFRIVHLTMYGRPIQKQISKIRKSKKILVVVGAEKVPGEVYRLADYNLAITNQPHSEIAALALFLHEYARGKELDKKFKKAKLKIVPQEHGKRVEVKK